MTQAEILDQVLRRVEEDPVAPVHLTEAQALAAVNEGLNIFGTLTLCVEKVHSFTINFTFTDILAEIPFLIVPLKLYRGTTRVHPGKVEEWRAQNVYWRMDNDYPTEYCMIGSTLLAVNKAPLSAAHVMTFAATPAVLASDSQVPEIPLEDHPALVEYGVWRLKTFGGGQEFVAEQSSLERFVAAAQSRAEKVRARYKQFGYDRTVPELREVGW